MSSAALADGDGERKFGYSIAITGTSDYIFRGISFNNEDPAFQPFIEFTYGTPNLTWYLDFWGSNIAEPFGPFELDIYAGVRPVTGPVSWDLGVLYYTYPNNSIPGSSEGDYVEFKIAASITPVTNLTTGLTGYYTPDQGANYGETWTIEGNAAYTLPNFHIFTPVISGAVGYTAGTRNEEGLVSICACEADNYVYWNAGLKLTVDKYFMDFRYWDTNLSRSDGIDTSFTDSRFVFTAGVNLP
ncbi:TorF family putative porin [Hyphomicrobium sp.]|uniref:TorF family putative porin n=1 Tax=Hyphomicrobium sp. TaxID=82 RepID=UPI002D78A723|nr:TorF family putative porin [Hyphomicrobium sp.]HET6389173.1 TorF family putative porin [Hyphomicrobium sp.]